MTKKSCLICQRIKLIKNKKNPYFVKELKTGYVVLGDDQFFRGYTLFLCKKHKYELYDLKPQFKKDFLWEMSLVAEAVALAFHPRKLNYALLGNTVHHLHWHLIPRHADDPLPKRTVWSIPKKIRTAAKTKPSKELLKKFKISLEKKLDQVIKKS